MQPPFRFPTNLLRALLAFGGALLLAGCGIFGPKHVDGPAAATTVGDVTIQFAGVSAFTQGDLDDALADPLNSIKEEGLNRATADDAAFFLENYYRKNGYAFAEASYDLPGGKSLLLKINEGPLVILGDIRFAGNTHYPDPTNFQQYIIGQTRERYPASRKDLPYVEADVQKGVDLVQRFYQSQGYLNMQISPAAAEFASNRTRANLSVAITEGQRYRFGAVDLNGPLVFPGAELRNLFAEEIKMPYTRPRVDAIGRRLEDYYKNHGYFTAQVVAESDPTSADASGAVPTKYTVAAGPLYRFDGTRIVGTDRLKPEFLRNRFRKLNGQVYDPAKLDEIYQQMIRTGLFSVLRVTPATQPDDTLRLDIDVKEARSREVGFSLGYGTFEGAILGVELRDRDFRGTGRPISLLLDYSTRTVSGELLYKDPYLFETNYELTLRGGALTRSLDGYDKQEFGASADLARSITKQLRVSAFVQTRKDKISMVKVQPFNAGVTDYSVSSMGLTATLDRRDNPVSPTRGLVTNGTFDVATNALGGDLSFVRGTFRVTYLQPIGGKDSKMTLALGFRGGIVSPFGDSKGKFEVDTDTDPKTPPVLRGSRFPIDERFFNGGSTSVRSFAERELGPYDKKSGDPIGGEAFTIINVEYLFPLVLADLRGAVFLDAGNLLADASEFGFANERYGVGAGLRYNLPIGPLRLDYGINPAPRQNEAFGAFHFSFGFAF